MSYAAQNKICSIRPLPCAWSWYFSKVEIPTMKPAVGNPTSPTKFYPKYETELQKSRTESKD